MIFVKSLHFVYYILVLYGSLFQDLSQEFQAEIVEIRVHSWKSFQKELHLPFEVKPSFSNH